MKMEKAPLLSAPQTFQGEWFSNRRDAAGKSKRPKLLFIQMHCGGFTFQQSMLEKCEISNEPTLQPRERGWNRMFSLLMARHMLYCKLPLYTYTNTAVSMVHSFFPGSQNLAPAVTSHWSRYSVPVVSQAPGSNCARWEHHLL